MKRLGLLLPLLLLVIAGFAQNDPAASAAREVVPRLLKFSGTISNVQGVTGVTFALYKQQTGGAPLWLETQNVTVDQNGRYTIFLGANHAGGLPLDLFSSGEARWLSVQPEGQNELPRTLLVSVPYALSAGNAATLGGLPASAFLQAPTSSASGTYVNTAAVTQAAYAISGAVTNSIPKFTSTAGDMTSSAIYDSNGFIGIGTSGPGRILHIKSPSPDIRLEDTHFANSFWELQQSAYVDDWFGFLRYESNTAVPTKSLIVTNSGNFGFGVTNPYGNMSEKVNVGPGNLRLWGTTGTDGVIFPDGSKQLSAATGTITGVSAGTGLTGGGASGNVTLGIAPGAVVKSLNGQTDTVTLAGTNGLAVSQSGGLVTVTANATPGNTGSTIVARDAAGNFSAGTVSLAGILALPNTTGASVGGITLGGSLFLHNFGSANTFVGIGAGNTTLTGSYNTAVGSRALGPNTTGWNNAAFGSDALMSNTGGSFNTAFGRQALMTNTTGVANAGFGYEALTSNTTGSDNSAFGSAMFANTTGWSNVAFGYDTLSHNTEGNNNAAFGVSALRSNTVGGSNNAFGFSALSSLSSGSGNIAIGQTAGNNLTGGSSNIYIGSPGGASSESFTIRIGTVGTHSAAYMAGISGATSPSGVAVLVNSSGQLGTATSSARFKEQVTSIGAESAVLMKLRPVAFYYKPEYDSTQTRQYGLVAEEVASVAPQLVVFDEEGAPQTVRYQFLNALLLNEVQKQQRLIAEQQARIENLEARIARLEVAAAEVAERHPGR